MTGTFDNWSKSEKMDKVGDVFEKAVDLPDTSEKIYYKVGVVLVSIVCGCPLSFHLLRCACPAAAYNPPSCDT